MELQPESLDDLQNGGELRIASRGQCFVEAFPAKAGLAGNLGHALGAGNVAQRCRYQGGIPVLEHRLMDRCSTSPYSTFTFSIKSLKYRTTPSTASAANCAPFSALASL